MAHYPHRPNFKRKCKFCGESVRYRHHADCPINAGSGAKKSWERGYAYGNRGQAELEAAVSAAPPGWS